MRRCCYIMLEKNPSTANAVPLPLGKGGSGAEMRLSMSVILWSVFV